jgi:hypothetical protein
MRDIPCSGYTVLVTDFKPLLTAQQQQELDSLIEDPAAKDKICDLLATIPGIPPIVEIFYYGEEEFSDELEQGNFYVVFDESDLFEKTPKHGLTFLNSAQINPEFARWSVWC